MDFTLAPEDEASRLEVREFLRKEWDHAGFDGHSLPVRAYDFDNPESREHDKAFIRRLIDQGWFTMHWLAEWGGQDAPLGK